MDDNTVVVAIAFFGTIAITIWSIARVWGKRIDARRPDVFTNDFAQRLDRIETAVDAIAVEVERIGESQRFTTRLDAERAARRIPVASALAGEGMVATPH